MQKNILVRKLRLISKFVTLQAGQQIFAILILLNIPKRKDNQAMKLGQLIKNNMSNIFPQIPCI